MSIERHIVVEEIPLGELFGVENQHFNQIKRSFTHSKIIARGNHIVVQGPENQVAEVAALFDRLVSHYQQAGELTAPQLASYLTSCPLPADSRELILKNLDGKPIQPCTPNQQRLHQAFQQHALVFVTGPSGTGKTFLSVAWALRALRRKEVKRIIITRPAIEAGESLGFLPGELHEKISPYIQPIYDALHQMVDGERLAFYKNKGVIEIIPLAYMRGRTLSHDFIILDEAQNTTVAQLKMFLTRMGVGSRVVVTGDLSQVDLPSRKLSGLRDATKRLQGIRDIAFVELEAVDVMRHQLVRSILKAYED